MGAERLTWAVLLGRWVSFARSSVAWPDDAAGRRMRASVPDLIQLQAVWFALEHLGELPDDQRALGLDRAELLIETHADRLTRRWGGEALPTLVGELIEEAREALARAAR